MQYFAYFFFQFTEACEEKRWIVYYSDAEPAKKFLCYSPVVFDSDTHPLLLPLIENHQDILGYLSLGEVERERKYFNEVKQEGLLLDENKNWPGSFFIDLRDPRWARRVIEELIPNILYQRFNGIFLDTLDNAEYLESRYPGMKRAAENLIKAIRHHYPSIKIMLNRAYFLLPSSAKDIDMELGESIFTDFDFQKKIYQKVDPKEYQRQVRLLQDVKKSNPNLEIYTLDYWYPDQHEMIKHIYKVERDNGFIPYVSTIDLHQITQEPE